MPQESAPYTAIIIHAPIGGGKTHTSQTLVAKAKRHGIQVNGVVSPCIKSGKDTVGYDGVDVAQGESFPLVRLDVEGDDWFSYGAMKYRFAKAGFLRANRILSRTMAERGLVIVDEYGRMEREGEGLYPGFAALTRRLKSGVLAVACRGDLVDHVKGQLNTEDVYVYHADDVKAVWGIIVDKLL